jgi:hypothetical protein
LNFYGTATVIIFPRVKSDLVVSETRKGKATYHRYHSVTNTMDGKGKERKGHWTKEEMEYLYALKEDFREGALNIDDGSTLRSYLAKQLNCGVKRISKKMEGSGYNGGQSFARMPFPEDELKARAAKRQRLKESFERSAHLHEQLKNSRFGEIRFGTEEAQHRAGAGDNPASILSSHAFGHRNLQTAATAIPMAHPIGLMGLSRIDLLVARMAGMGSLISSAGLPGNGGWLGLHTFSIASPGMSVSSLGGNIGGRHETNNGRLAALRAGFSPAYQPPPQSSLADAAGLKRALNTLALQGANPYQIEPNAKRSRMN